MENNERREKPLLYMDEFKIKQDPHDYGLADEPIDITTFKRRFRTVVVRYDGDDLEFDMIGLHPAIANSIRRIMISEVPSMAIEKVYIYNNTSIVQDEVLAHRLGLIPLKADPKLFEFRSDDSTELGTEHDTLEYELKVKCTRRKDASEPGSHETIYKNHAIHSGQIKWLPRGKQSSFLKESDVGCIHDDILISKMRPGHEFDIKLLAIKGIGKDHAKFSPVATAFYRLLPEIRLTRVINGNDASLLQKCFSPGVIEIDDKGSAYVKNARYDTCSRNVFRYPNLADAVVMARVRDHFIFTVESVGAFLHSLLLFGKNEENNIQVLTEYFKELVFCRPNLWVFDQLSNCSLIIIKRWPKIMNNLCVNSDEQSFITNHVKCIYQFADTSCVIQVSEI